MKPSPPSTNIFRAVALVAGCALIAAALLKGEHALGSSDGLAGWLARTVAPLAFEAGLGLLLVLRPWLRPVQLAALLTFAIFACVALYKAALGLPSCGCFGKVNVPPIRTASFDVMVVVALAWLTPNDCPRMLRRIGLGMAGVTLIALAGMGAGKDWIRARAVASVDDAGGLTTAGAIVLLEPGKWTDKQLPILKHLDVAEQLAKGSWTLILYHHDCSTCRELMPGYERRARESSQQIALIEMPPYAPPGESPVSPSSQCLLGKLSDKHEWFATTPVVLTLVDGRVTSVMQGEEAVAHAPR